jgi:hypothetical protein
VDADEALTVTGTSSWGCALAVVDDLHLQRVIVVVQAHGRPGRTGMLEHVGERFLDDAERRQIDTGREADGFSRGS